MMTLAIAASLLLAQTGAPTAGDEQQASAGAGLTWAMHPSSADRAVLARFGDCVATAYPKQAKQAVLGWAVNPKSVNVLYDINTRKCLSSMGLKDQGLRIQPALLRYVLADALARLMAGSVNVTNLSGLPPLIHPAIVEANYLPAPGEVFDEAKRKQKAASKASFTNYIALSRLGECAVRADPKNAKALLTGKPGSLQERASFEAIMPALEGCSAGMTVRASEIAVRGEIGAALLRLHNLRAHRNNAEAN